MRVRHVLADGAEVDSIEGMVIPITGPAAAAYRIVVDILKGMARDGKDRKAKADADARAGEA